MLAADIAVRVARLPPDEDPDSLLRTKGPEAFQACLDAAESLVAFQVHIALEAEKNPESYDAISRAAKAVLELVRQSTNAVTRASLLQEASTLLNVPVEALKEELEKIKDSPRVEVASDKADAEKNASDGHLDSEAQSAGSDVLPEEDAASRENNPPPKTEMQFMEFLFGNGPAGDFADKLESYAPDMLFKHDLTRAFVHASVSL